MPTVSWLLSKRNSGPIAACSVDDTVLDAAVLMNERMIGSVAVLDGDRLVGIFTERDILQRIVAVECDPAATRLGDVMSAPVTVAASNTPLDMLRTIMRDAHIRHIPIVDDDTPIAMVSIGDLNKAHADEQNETIHALETYVSIR
ncbi:MAG: CBS domain-containing protein [Phycisphaerales bacterium]|jgi:CBS domain-containing protein|nr:CBS domain-containing protein [Phycisphaerales bacterium]MDP7086245.1 CBS domain-containing protein [Phycisphaerales bacterium]|tara:strand:+ start:204 stop:638 length:435 start_codon:yes stop_codon:yes gene_type:complete